MAFPFINEDRLSSRQSEDVMAAIRRAIWPAVLTMAALAALTMPAAATSGADLLRQCESLDRGAVVRGRLVRLPEKSEAAQCWFYMAAVQDFAATVEEESGPSLIGACPPADATRLDLIRSYLRYARAHRDELGLRASALLVRALSEAYPCPAR